MFETSQIKYKITLFQWQYYKVAPKKILNVRVPTKSKYLSTVADAFIDDDDDDDDGDDNTMTILLLYAINRNNV